MDRRKFVKQSCSLCLATGAGMLIGSLASCGTALPVYKTTIANNKIAVPVSLFANSDFQLIQPKNLYYNIGLKKEKDGSYTALLLRCTHADNQLISAGNGFKCTLHGSAFDNEGRVTNGPAERPLKKYPTQIESDQIIISIS
ncbi:ubiquinol-cytochrome c reductase iron-sulfur subunit [Mucilaginibacter sp. OK098]|uniref:QcrA and Rieske domain-containing protein n=1 Tax=Mucilaginibacter sp. OK098 TaxID=1855297 RepID=UPI0009352A89|nr:Rieske (2Fe-2S) protein [Mucilaginibacter sp. OK098]